MVINEPALSPIEMEAALVRVSAHLNDYQRRAFVTLAERMIHRFEVNRWRSQTPISYSEIIVQALANFARAASEATTGDMDRALSCAADAANLLALRLTQEKEGT